MNRTRRNSIMLLALLLCAGIPITLAAFNYYWQQTMNPATFHFHYEECQAFTCTNWDDYKSKISSLDLLNERMTMLTITKNTVLTPLFLECTFSSTAGGAGLTASGQYYISRWIGGSRETLTSGSSFDIPTNGTSIALDMDKIMWADWGLMGEEAWALEITFTVDKSGITETYIGDFTFTVDLGVGTE